MDDEKLENMLKIDDDEINSKLSRNGIEKRIILRTCNRLELYYDVDVNLNKDDFQNAEFIRGEDAIKHILRVSAGLESMSIGENEILRQIKEALDIAMKNGRSNKFLSMIFTRAIKLGKEIREKTAISHGKVSIPSIMVEQMSIRGFVNGKKIGVIGTGKMAATIVKYLIKEPKAGITIFGRNDEAGMELAQLFGVSFKRNLDMNDIISQCDAIVTATSSKTPLIMRNIIENIKKKMLFIDISNPKNVEDFFTNNLVELINLDAANNIMNENRKRKESDIIIAENMIDAEMLKIYSKIAESEIEEYISNIYGRGREVLINEIDKCISAINNGHSMESSLEAMGNSIINKILAPQTLVLKRMVREKKTETIREFLNSSRNLNADDSEPDHEDQIETQSQQDQNHRLFQTL
ncbi:MAG: NAD(P)-binding domain-containing protein [Candidatus Thermoplasmatota archaeon]|nr:NAD(P)-binding domain-containing protein [Candidatus Thermoplasmatota archaeon]